mgnify:CR=1 FL=1
MMSLSQRGLALIAEHEGKIVQNNLHCMYDDATGKIITKYDDANGYPTIGYGHLITEEEKKQGLYLKGIDETHARELLMCDANNAVNAVNKFVKVPLNQDQFDALVSFTFNVGSGSLKSSTLLKLLNSGKYNEAANQFLRWNKFKGQPLAGLTNRRKKERALFLSEI